MYRTKASVHSSTIFNLRRCVVAGVMAAVAAAAVIALGIGGRGVIPILFAVHAAPAATIKGEWSAELNRRGIGELQISFSRRADKSDFNILMGDSIAIGDLQGLSAADVSGSGKTNVSFRLVREPGTFACEGYFSGGKGTGFWAFTPSSSFASSMKSRGYANLTDEDMLRAALHNLTTKYIEDLKTAGYDHLEFEQLSRGAGHDVSVAFIRELQTAGFSGLTMEELIRARNHEIDSRYINEVAAMGFEKQTLESIIRLRNHEISQGFIDQMKSAGFTDLSADTLIRLKNHEITPEFVNDLKAEGFTDISADLAIRVKNHEVDRDFIRRAKAQGYTNATLDDLIRLRNRGTVK